MISVGGLSEEIYFMQQLEDNIRNHLLKLRA